MRKIDPMFDETRHGHLSFLDFLRAHEELIDLYKPAVGDLVIAPRGLLGEDRDGDTATNGRGAIATNGYHPSTSAVAAAAPGQGYHDWLRDNNFRYVPQQDRHQIIGVIFDLFDRHAETGVSLKEIKDHLHGWFEQNRPFVPWDSINSTVYHLFYTWCFTFERTDGEADKQLWDRRTCLQNDIHSSHDLIVRCERGIVRKLWEHDRDLDPEALNEWLYDGDPEMLNYVTDLIAKAATIGAVRFAHGISHSSVSGHSG